MAAIAPAARLRRAPDGAQRLVRPPLGVKLAALVGVGAVSLGVVRRRSPCRRCRAPVRRTDDAARPAPRPPSDVLLADMMHDAVRGDVLRRCSAAGRAAPTSGGRRPRAEHDESPRHPRRDGRGRPEPRGGARGGRRDAGGRGLPRPPPRRSSRLAGIDPAAGPRRLPAVRRGLRALEEELPALERRSRPPTRSNAAAAGRRAARHGDHARARRRRPPACWCSPCSAG